MNTLIRFYRRKVSPIFLLIAAVTCVTAYNLLKASAFGSAPLSLGLTAEEETREVNKQLTASLGSINERLAKISEIEKSVAKNKEDYEAVTKLIVEVQKINQDMQRKMTAIAVPRLPVRKSSLILPDNYH